MEVMRVAILLGILIYVTTAAIQSDSSSETSSEAMRSYLEQAREAALVESCRHGRELTEQSASGSVMLGVALTLASLTSSALLHHFHLYFIPESVITIAFGMLIGICIRYATSTSLFVLFAFDAEFFYIVLLPPIIFYAGYSLNKRHFFNNIGSIVLYAVVGTIISTLIVGSGLWILGKIYLSKELSIVIAFMFASLISAIDPVATIAIFETLHVNPTLHYLIFGESVLNDAVAIVLYRTVEVFYYAEPSIYSLLYGLVSFCVISVGSTVIGFSSGLVTALFFKWLPFSQFPHLEIFSLFIWAYFPYLLGEALGLSGIMAVLFAGITISHYAHYNLSPTAQITTQQAFHTIAITAEAFVFAYLGLALFTFEHRYSPLLIFWAIVLCFVGRAFNTFPLTFLLNLVRKKKVSYRNQTVIWFSGLRGAIAFSLAISVPGSDGGYIITTTLAIILFTVIFLGGGTLPLLSLLKIERIPKKEMTVAEAEEDILRRAAGTNRKQVAPAVEEVDEGEDGEDVSTHYQEESWFERLDRLYLRPFFCVPVDEGDQYAIGSLAHPVSISSLVREATPVRDRSLSNFNALSEQVVKSPGVLAEEERLQRLALDSPRDGTDHLPASSTEMLSSGFTEVTDVNETVQ